MKTLVQLIERVKKLPNKRLVVANGIDTHTLEAVSQAIDERLIDAVVVGDKKRIEQVCQKLDIDMKKFEIVDVNGDIQAANTAVQIVSAGDGDLLMKGLVSTDRYMRAILNKEYGLVPPKGLLTHITVMQTPNYHKLLIFGDVAIIPNPDLKQKVIILRHLINVAHRLDIQRPKVALIAASEQITESMPSTIDAAVISKMAQRGQIKDAIVEGPLGLDLAIDKESAEIKGLDSEVGGDADCLLFPNIDAGNVFYKTNTKLAGAQLAAFVAGAKVPCILSSRGDSAQTKLYSIALASLLS